ncbi:MAG: hypothetical protein CMJ18_10150 [Phycisphaeraceae bacterium]|nr:hypothetical protein [Phycisphaeraceae bacterium]
MPHKTALGLNGFGWAHVISGLDYDLDRILDHAVRLGFDGIELFGLPDPYPETDADRRELRRRIEDRGLTVASIQSLPGGLGNGHPASAYSLCRNQYVDFIRASLDFAQAMGSDSLGVWAGELFGTGPNAQSRGYMVETYGRCAELAQEAGMPLNLEAEPVQQVNTPDVWLQILDGVDSPFMKGVFDFAHVNVMSGQKPHDLLERMRHHVGYTHICGNDGSCTDFESRSSTHLSLGDGSLDAKALLNDLLDGGYDGWLDIDLWEHPEPFAGADAGKRALDGFLAAR